MRDMICKFSKDFYFEMIGSGLEKKNFDIKCTGYLYQEIENQIIRIQFEYSNVLK